MTQSCTKAGGEAAEDLAGLYLVAQSQLTGAIREKGSSPSCRPSLSFSTCLCVVVFSCNFLAGAGISFSTRFGSLDHMRVPESQKLFDLRTVLQNIIGSRNQPEICRMQ